MRALVTGATGFLGGWLVPALLKKGYEVRILCRNSSDLSELPVDEVEKFIGDVTDQNSLLEAAKDCDEIYHLAGVIAYEPEKLELMQKVNVEGTKNILKVCKELKISKLLYLSSVVAIGASFDGNPLNEESDFNINHLNLGYFDTKREAEDLVREAVKFDGLKAYIVNPSTIYGRGDAKKGSRKTQVKVAKGEFPFYPSGGVNVVAVEDVIDGIFLAMEKGEPGRRYVLSGENITIKQLFEKISAEAGVKAPKIPLNRAVMKIIGSIGDIVKPLGISWPVNSENAWTTTLFHWFDNKRAKEELGFKPKPAQHAIHESVAYMKENKLI